jgi:hypothetical protein
MHCTVEALDSERSCTYRGQGHMGTLYLLLSESKTALKIIK